MSVAKAKPVYLTAAIKYWNNVLGEKNVILDKEILRRVEVATYKTVQSIPVILRPDTSDEIQQCVKIANQYNVPLYPISGGKNWWFGSRVPPKDRCAILDLSRLNRISDFNETLAFITVEPGVTFNQVHEFIRSKKSKLFLNVPGTTPNASLIGNALERGHGAGIYADRFAYMCNLEVVLPNGSIIRTGLGRYPQATASKVEKWGIGPYFDGIFTQSNLGIVTQATFWLSPLPDYFQLCYFGVNKTENFDKLIDVLQKLKLIGVIKSPITIWNDYKLISTLQQYPWKQSLNKTPLPEKLTSKLQKANGISLWNGWISLYSASKQIGTAERLILQKQLLPLVDTLFISDSKKTLFSLGDHKIAPTKFRNFNDSPFWGCPSTSSIFGTYWRKTKKPTQDMNIDEDRCGKIANVFSVPFESSHAKIALRIIEEKATLHGFEPITMILGINERSLNIISFIVYDRDVLDEDDKAENCSCSILECMFNSGYIANRLPVHYLKMLPKSSGDFGKFVKTIKTVLDPNDILAPGKHDFRNEW